MATTPSLKIMKTMPFKGGVRVWSNRYHFTGGTPADLGSWTALATAVVNLEKTIYSNELTITGFVGYDPGSDVPVASGPFSVVGTLGFVAGTARTPGEVAAVLRWSTDARTVKNHPIYLFKYFHGAFVQSVAGEQDLLEPSQGTAILAYGNDWITGITGGGVTAKIASPEGAHGVTPTVKQYVSHRDFPPTSST